MFLSQQKYSLTFLIRQQFHEIQTIMLKAQVSFSFKAVSL